MRILSLFDGMACGMIAMQAAGIEVNRYVAYEIDKYAVQTSSHNFPMIEHRGDVFEADFSEFVGFDWLIGGSPCTYWSIAQKNNRETEASGIGWELFSQYVRALHEAQPKYFIYENNKSMSKQIRASIDEAFGFDAVLINSALVSAQNRQRLYWVGKRNADGTYSKVDVRQPVDRGILLKDILDSGCDLTSKDKSYTLTASYNGAVPWNTIERNQKNMVAEPVCVAQRGRYSDIGNRSRKGEGPIEQFYEAREDSKTNALTTVQKDNAVAEPVAINTADDGKKARTLMAGYYKYGTATLITNEGFKGGTTAVADPVRVGTYPNNAKNQDKHDSQQYRIYSTEGKGVTLCGNGGEMGAKTGLYAIPVEFVRNVPKKAISGSDGKVYPVYEVKDGKIDIKGKLYPIKLIGDYYIIRKLTVSECKRLQTVPEWYEFPVSDTQALKMLGNGWTVDVIVHLIKSTF